ncbi:peptide-methionine (S)-S-oxide reductase MsrA [Thiotrichales bacterium 19S3-7]|nr:peptide-methionine (S)-S-oxide reductase MsrA [Thiotrichales bacterium 19S3-7]MCF6800651.1 peptide-methionine (S)-S-oxide reductase MsrA [Thiotrichales bacterium 19S3-11]
MLYRLQLLLILLVTPAVFFAKEAKAIFAGGCFWCMEADFYDLKENNYPSAIIKITPGYDGGTIKNPNYGLVSSGQSNYKEVVEVIYDPQKVSYKTLVKFFFLHIDPTVKDQQFCDVGKQYASAIYYTNTQQKQIALSILKQVKTTLNQPVFTEILASTEFYKAEEYHQQYYKKNPLRYKYYRWRCDRDSTVNSIWLNKSLD